MSLTSVLPDCCQNEMFPVIKLFFILDQGVPSKHKVQFLNYCVNLYCVNL